MPDTLRWSAFASKLVTKCCDLFASSEVAITARGKADRSVLALLLLARTLSNLKAVLVLIRERQIGLHPVWMTPA